jgi:hypothetical protein
MDKLPLICAGANAIVWHESGALERLAGEYATFGRLNGGRAIAGLRGSAIEIIHLDRNNERRTIAEDVNTCLGSPRTNAVYALMLNGQLESKCG